MSTLVKGIAAARKGRVQVHWIVPGLVSVAYSVKSGTKYNLYKAKGEWRCECIFARNFARGGNVCKHISATIIKEIKESLVYEGRSPEQAAVIIEHYKGMLDA